ncbi:hypothetical protein [Achromobacter sp.]|uniref:hypothetical protein n=1 Tax=Achromobacter sp. TaxID=134375 RepID=UPI002F95A95D
MKPVINDYVRELSHPGYDAARRNAFVAAMVSKRLMRRTADQREAGEADAARTSALADNTATADVRAGNAET